MPLVDAYRRARSEAADAAAALRALSERRDQVREEMRAVIAAAREREERVAQLQAELERLPRDVRRELYTDRILEIIKQVKKQQVDIDKILIEIHQVHKEINAITESLSRSFNATDELIYKVCWRGCLFFSFVCLSLVPAYLLIDAVWVCCRRLARATSRSNRFTARSSK